MKLRKLEEYLQDVEGFRSAKVELEQYATSAHLAAMTIYTAETQYNDIEGKLVADLGAGTGSLSIAAVLMGAPMVVAVDIDADALDVLEENTANLEMWEVDAVQADILSGAGLRGSFDTVVMNPPFGTRRRGADAAFVIAGLSLAPVVYSLHKTSTRDYLVDRFNKGDTKCEVLAQLRFDLPKTYKFHTKVTTDIDVDLIRVSTNDK